MHTLGLAAVDLQYWTSILVEGYRVPSTSRNGKRPRKQRCDTKEKQAVRILFSNDLEIPLTDMLRFLHDHSICLSY